MNWIIKIKTELNIYVPSLKTVPFGGWPADEGPGVDTSFVAAVGEVQLGVLLLGDAPIGTPGSASCLISCMTPAIDSFT